MKLNIDAALDNFEKRPRGYILVLLLLAIIYLAIDNRRLEAKVDKQRDRTEQVQEAQIITLKETVKQQKDVFEIQKHVVDAALYVLHGDSTNSIENQQH